MWQVVGIRIWPTARIKERENMVTQSEKNCFFLFLLVKEMAAPVQKLQAIEEALCAAEDV